MLFALSAKRGGASCDANFALWRTFLVSILSARYLFCYYFYLLPVIRERSRGIFKVTLLFFNAIKSNELRQL